MMSLRVVVCAAAALTVLVDWSTSLPTAQLGDQEIFTNQLDMMADGDDDEQQQQIERDFLNYLVGRRFVKRSRTLVGVGFQRKRNYWRQCAFNAVSCFGKRK